MAKMRRPVSRKKSRKSFAKTARPHRKNFKGAPMRGGIRL